jgi:shikimate 5-dehydrogenase
MLSRLHAGLLALYLAPEVVIGVYSDVTLTLTLTLTLSCNEMIPLLLCYLQETAMQVAQEVDPVAASIGAVNTLIRQVCLL